MHKNIFLLISLCILNCLELGCESKRCPVNFSKYDLKDAPIIYIDSFKEGCNFNFNGQFWLGDKHFKSGGELTFENNAIYLVLDAIPANRIKYFDFSKKKGENYTIEFITDSAVFNFNSRVDRIIRQNNGVTVFVFRIDDAFSIDAHLYDLVFFVSKENGITGSYISELKPNLEIVIGERGNILRNEIDYSEKEFGVFE